MKTLIVMPLIVQNDLQGVLEVLSIKEPGFTSGQIEILSVVANDLAGGMSRKRLIDELRMKNLELEAQTQKTQEASDTLKKFLAMFSHELRSPLNSIIGLISNKPKIISSKTQIEDTYFFCNFHFIW